MSIRGLRTLWKDEKRVDGDKGGLDREWEDRDDVWGEERIGDVGWQSRGSNGE